MSWEMMAAGSQQPQTLKLGDRDYWLMPMSAGDHASQRDRAQRSALQRFDSAALENIPEFHYDQLPSSKKRVRLLQLRSGTTHGSEIFCELIEADYDNSFHILTKVNKEEDEMEENEDKDGKRAKETKEEKAKRLAENKEKRLAEERKKRDEEEEKKRSKELPEETKKRHEQEVEKKLEEEWKRVKANEIKYEAVSWCWGIDPPHYAVQILKDGKTYKKSVRKELALAMKYLRLADQTRTLWIDAICINQDDPEERNRQVQMMARIYTRSKEVCIWLGEDTDESKLAIDFIRQDIMELKNFDSICSDKRYTGKWQALMILMQRDWFSRRWVVQEIALASKAKVYCGPDSIPWKDFAVAVELFVEVETATHRLSEVMQKDEKFRHIPGWFEYVSELGASLLVQATGKVFRAQRTPLDDGPGEIQDVKELLRITRNVNTIDPLDRRSLLSLEFLVSTMFIFKATEPRDVVYSLLAVARDAAPLARSTIGDEDGSFLIMSLFDHFLEEKPFIVDYSRPYSDVCRDFIEFSIKRKARLDPVQALDILCRPLALESQDGRSIRLTLPKVHQSSDQSLERKRKWGKEPWKKRKGKVVESKTDDGRPKFEYVWEDPEDRPESRVEDKRDTEEYWKETEEKKYWDDSWKRRDDWDKIKTSYFRDHRDGSTSTNDESDKQAHKDISLPLWVARAAQAPFSLYHHPGMHILKTGRANADPLVGQPQDGHRNYSAAQTEEVDLELLKFRKRPVLGHYSIYLTGFELDEVVEVRDASQGGNIPKSWLDLGGWTDYTKDPPDALWRTLVADRGRDNRNPPYYYARACKESVHKGGITSGRVNTTALINNERNSIVAEFCRRVHAVIWNRCLFKTKGDKLGLASKVQIGDKVCILYGCTVPVILRRHKKEPKDLEKEVFEDRVEKLKALIKKMVELRERKAKARQKIQKYTDEEKDELKVAQNKANYKLETERLVKETVNQATKDALKPRLESEDAQREKEESARNAEDESRIRAIQEKRRADEQELKRRKVEEARRKAIEAAIKEATDKRESLDEEKRKEVEEAAIAIADEEMKKRDEEEEKGKAEKEKKAKAEEQEREQEEKEAKYHKVGNKSWTEHPLLYYEFGGEAYVHGMMDGEALREKFYQQTPNRLFEIR